MKNPIVVNLCLLLIALIWGFGFVPQRLGMEYVGAGAFNALRFAIGAITIAPLLILMKSVAWSNLRDPATLKVGFILGLLLFFGATFQQISIKYTSLANVSFITGLYAIIVPMIGFFMGYRYAVMVWVGGIVAIIGLYLMTGQSTELSLWGDFLALIGAVFWALQLLVLARLSDEQEQLSLAFYQFVVCAAFSALIAVGYEGLLFPATFDGYFWPLINGVIVVGGAYTLQVIVLKHAEPFAASLILSLEAVFGALGGYLVFTERLGAAALVGAVMMLLGCLLVQIYDKQEAPSEA